LEGNRFEVTVRDLKRIQVDSMGGQPASERLTRCDHEHIEAMVRRIRKHGFINFYGEQRVGSSGSSDETGVRGFDIGRAMLQRKYDLAIDLLMTGRSICRSEHGRESDRVLRVRQAWKETGGDAKATIKAFQGGDYMPRERLVLKGLNRYGKDHPLDALRCLGYNMRMFWINAYQSLIWNKVASIRIQKCGYQVIKGDLYFEKDDINQETVRVAESDDTSSVSLSQVVLPLPGYNIRYPNNEIEEIYKNLLKQDDIIFEKEAPAESTAKGSYRRLIVHPSCIDLEVDDKCTYPGMKAKLTFELPKGCYATMLLRELMITTTTR
jgi:tRNA pseudouridine13 synthase